MRKWCQWNIRRWLKKHSLFEYFVVWHVNRHHLSPRHNRAFEKGQEFVEIEAARQYVNHRIRPAFAHAKDAINANIRHENALLKGEIGSLRDSIGHLTTDMDDKNEHGVVGKLQKEASATDTTVKHYGTLFFPEKQLQESLDKDHQQHLKGLNIIVDSGVEDVVTIEQALKRKSVNGYIGQFNKNFSEMRDRIREMIHSHRFPLSKSTYRGIFAICFLFVLAEMFISRKVLLVTSDSAVTLTPWPDANVIINEVITLLYAAAISVFLAALYNMVFRLGNYLVKNVLLVLLFAFITFFMSYFFSRSHVDEGSTDNFHPIGIMFGVLSAGFALANAWYYRQGAYLKDLYKTTFSGRSVKYCRRWIARWKWWLGWQLRGKRKKLIRLESQLVAYEVVNQQAVEQYLLNLERMYIAEFWHGFDTHLNQVIENNQEIRIAILKQVKTKLHHEEDKYVFDGRTNDFPRPGLSA